MNEIQGTVLSINAGTTKTGKTYWDVAFSDGQRYRAWDNALAQAANALVGQQATLGVDITQNGQYTNYNLRTVNAANGVLPGAPAPLPTPAPQQGRGRDPEVEARIVRQSSMATAFNFVGHVLSGSGEYDNAKETALALAKELFGHAFHGGGADKGQTPQQPSEVAAQVNTVLGTEAVTQGAPEATKDW